MGNSGSKEDDINNLMNVAIVKDADYPRTVIEANQAHVWRHVNERVWDVEMAKFEGFDQFNFYRAINPALSCGMKERIPGIILGNKQVLEAYRSIYNETYIDYFTLEKQLNDEGVEILVRGAFQVPLLRPIGANANKLQGVEDMTILRGMFIKVERNIEGFNLLSGVNSLDELLEIKAAIKQGLSLFDRRFHVDPTNIHDWELLAPKVFKKMVSSGRITKNMDPYLKAGGIQRWWPKGRGSASSTITNMDIRINEMEHFSLEWEVFDADYPGNFHTLFKQLNALHKSLKRQGYGGFWKDPLLGYVSVDPRKCGTMFTCSVDFKITAIPTFFSDEEVIKDCRETLGVEVNLVHKIPGAKVFKMIPAEPTWMSEEEQFGLLLNGVNRLAQLDRCLFYSPRKEGDTLFDMAAFRN